MFLLLLLLIGCESDLVTKVENETINRATPEEELKSDLTAATVVRHIDGDTLIANINGLEHRIRYLMIDTPEITQGKSEPFGQEALEFVESHVKGGQIIHLEFDKELLDPYDRTLAYIYLENGRMLNEILLERGLAKVTVFMPNNKYEAEFKAIEAEAKKNKIGLWSLKD